MMAKVRAQLTASGKRFYPSGGSLARHVRPKGLRAPTNLKDGHQALDASGTVYPTRVFDPADVPRALIEGVNSSKIGAKVVKGRWAGMPIYTLTLEERATCPTSCREWRTCYGNNMHAARRLRHGEALTSMLRRELRNKALLHPRGFVVRLHVLGDFYSADYVRFWTIALLSLPALRVFGFTAWGPETPIGRAVVKMNRVAGDRSWIRFSGQTGPRGAVVIEHPADSQHVVCPVETNRVQTCGQCGLCWSMNKTVEFVRH